MSDVSNQLPNSNDTELSARRQRALSSYLELVEKPHYQGLLEEAGQRYRMIEEFAEGDLVQWKPNMQTHRLPTYGNPMVYLGRRERASSPPQLALFDDLRETVFRDVLVGFLDGDQDFVVIAVESARITHYP